MKNPKIAIGLGALVLLGIVLAISVNAQPGSPESEPSQSAELSICTKDHALLKTAIEDVRTGSYMFASTILVRRYASTAKTFDEAMAEVLASDAVISCLPSDVYSDLLAYADSH